MILNPVDFKNFIYCPRQVFYKYIHQIETEPTEKMIRGKIIHMEYLYLEKRRKLNRYNLENMKKIFEYRVFSSKYGISGIVDMVFLGDGSVYPLDFKTSKNAYLDGYKLQVYAYSLALSDNFKRLSEFGFIYFINTGEILKVYYDTEIKEKYYYVRSQIEKMLSDEIFPQGADERDKCCNCEYLNYCSDVL